MCNCFFLTAIFSLCIGSIIIFRGFCLGFGFFFSLLDKIKLLYQEPLFQSDILTNNFPLIKTMLQLMFTAINSLLLFWLLCKYSQIYREVKTFFLGALAASLKTMGEKTRCLFKSAFTKNVLQATCRGTQSFNGI